MKVRSKLDQREGKATKFNKYSGTGDHIFVDFEDNGQEESLSAHDLEVWLTRSDRYVDLITALRNKLIQVSGGPVQIVEM